MHTRPLSHRLPVLPYQEFSHPQRLTDAAWKTLLDSPRRPETPAWIKPVMTAEGQKKEKGQR